jgi:hypothetical protein
MKTSLQTLILKNVKEITKFFSLKNTTPISGRGHSIFSKSPIRCTLEYDDSSLVYGGTTVIS